MSCFFSFHTFSLIIIPWHLLPSLPLSFSPFLKKFSWFFPLPKDFILSFPSYYFKFSLFFFPAKPFIYLSLFWFFSIIFQMTKKGSKANLEKTPADCISNNQEPVIFLSSSEEESSHSLSTSSPNKHPYFSQNMTSKKPHSNVFL